MYVLHTSLPLHGTALLDSHGTILFWLWVVPDANTWKMKILQIRLVRGNNHLSDTEQRSPRPKSSFVLLPSAFYDYKTRIKDTVPSCRSLLRCSCHIEGDVTAVSI